jgi:uncharacterized lipoprotein YmbA
MMLRQALVVLVLAAAGCGGSLTSKAPPLEVHYYTLDVGGRTTPPCPSAPDLAMGSIHASSFLRDRIVFREGDGRLGTYDQWRWTEYPEEYFRRALSHALFERGRFVERRGDVPKIDAELIELEEVRRETHSTARVRMAYAVRTGDTTTANETIVVEREIPKDAGIEAVVHTLESAMSEGAERIARAVEGRLSPGACNPP